MQLQYPNKRDAEVIVSSTAPAALDLVASFGSGHHNLLIHGGNLRVMKTLCSEHRLIGKVDLVYIDPPFSTNAVYRHNSLRTQTVSSAPDDAIAYADKLKGPDYLEFIRERLVFLRELMAPHASIYLHIDYKVGHYVKVIMDEVFGARHFRNDISRIKCNPKNFARRGYGNVKDLILFYTKSNDFVWNEPRFSLQQHEIARLFPKVDPRGRRFTTTPLHAPGETRSGKTGREWRGQLPPKGRHWRCDPAVLEELDRQGRIEWSSTGNPRKIVYADEAMARGKRLQDIWEYKDPQYPKYPTEKNLELLKNIVRTSSNPGQVILDCFCGSGTSLVAAQELGRSWIGIDESEIAISTASSRLRAGDASLPCIEAGFKLLREHVGVHFQPIKSLTDGIGALPNQAAV